MSLLDTKRSGCCVIQQLESVAKHVAAAPYALISAIGSVIPRAGCADRRSRSSEVFVLRGQIQLPSLWLSVLR